MRESQLSRLHKQINAVRRRLSLQMFVNTFVFCLAGGLLLAAFWLLVQPTVLSGTPTWLGWAILGGALVGGAVFAVAWTWLRAPSRLEAALALDEKFGLKERVTTTLTITDEQAASPAGRALIHDVQRRIQSVYGPSRFPLRLQWKTTLFPIAAGTLAVLALLFAPDLSDWLSDNSSQSQQLSAAEIKQAEKHLNELRKLGKKKKEDEATKSKELKELEAEWNKLLEQQVDLRDKNKLREHTQKLRDLEEKMKKRMDDLKSLNQRKNRLQKQLEQLRAMAPKGDKAKDGPAKDLVEALKKNDMKKAQDELEKLKKRLEDKKLSKDELKKLQDQLEEMKRQLERLTDERDRKKQQLEKEQELGNLDQEQLDQLERELEQLDDLKDIQDLLEQCKNCAKAGDAGKLAGKLGDLLDRLKNLEGELKEIQGELKDLKLSEDELKKLAEEAKILAKCRQGLCRALGQRASRRPGGQRPKGEDEDVQHRNARQKAEVDTKGHLKITGFSRGGSFRKIAAEDVPAAFRNAQQGAQQAIEAQRITSEAAEILKGYYENLGNQKK